MSATEGLKGVIYISTGTAVVAGSVIALLTGIELSWSQTAKRFYSMGSLQTYQVLKGPIQWDGSFKKAYTDNKWLGTFNLGTYLLYGSITPGTAYSPAILGTMVLTGGRLSNMTTESVNAIEEDNTFILYNVSFLG